jgi:hypothetical protein
MERSAAVGARYEMEHGRENPQGSRRAALIIKQGDVEIRAPGMLG